MSTDTLDLSPEVDVAVNESAHIAILDQILAKAHDIVRDGLYLAAIPHTFTLPVLTAVRGRNDGNDPKLFGRLSRFSFIWEAQAPDTAEETLVYDRLERNYLLTRLIRVEPRKFILGHERMLAYREANPHSDEFRQVQHRLAHLLILDENAGISLLLTTFRKYLSQHRLAVLDRLLDTAQEAQTYRTLLHGRSANLDHHLDYLSLRLRQYRGEWHDTLGELTRLQGETDLPDGLRPFVIRALALAKIETEQYVEAIADLEVALHHFQTQNSADETAYTMLSLGDAHVRLATSARGYNDLVLPPANQISLWQKLTSFIPPPLFIYLWQRGFNVLNPDNWMALSQQDWIIARLFGDGANWYRRAQKVANAQDGDSRIQAMEKLGQLGLRIGDFQMAQEQFGELLEVGDSRFEISEQSPISNLQSHSPLDPYRRASVQLGLGEAWLRLGEAQRAIPQIEAAERTLTKFEDAVGTARSLALVGEAYYLTGDFSKGRVALESAIAQYETRGDEVAMTETVERLQMLASILPLPTDEREQALLTATAYPIRRYQVRFQHRALTYFRRLSLVLLAMFVFLVPALTIRVDNGLTLPDLTFGVELPAFEPATLSVSVPDITFTPSFPQEVIPTIMPEPALFLGIGLMLFFVVVYTLLGLLLIYRTPLHTVQAAQAQAVRFSGETVSSGDLDLPLHQVSEWVKADVKLFRTPLAGESNMSLTTPQGRVKIQGQTAWYDSLQRRLPDLLPNSTTFSDLSFRVLPSLMGFVYLGFLLMLALFFVATLRAPNLVGRNTGLLGLSFLEYYPLLYLGLLLPTFWWLVVQPLRHEYRLHGNSRYAYYVLGAGLLLSSGRLLFFRFDFMPLPDIYPGLVGLVLLGSGWFYVLREKDPHPNPLPEGEKTRIAGSLWQRLPWVARAGIGLLSLVVALGVLGQLFVEVRGFGQFVQANRLRLRAATLADGDPEKAAMQARSGELYGQVIDNVPAFLPAYTQFAALKSETGEYEQAIATYTQALDIDDGDNVYAGRALIYQSWGSALLAEGSEAEANLLFVAAAQDLAIAYDKNPNDDYLLWEAYAFHATGDWDRAEQLYAEIQDDVRADVGQGWVHYQRGLSLVEAGEQPAARAQFRQALDQFEVAAEKQTDVGVWQAIGAITYQFGNYEAAAEAWGEALAVEPENAGILVSYATVNWQLGQQFGDTCSRDNVSLADKEQAGDYFATSVAAFQQATELVPDNIALYRYQGQMHYLRRNCPNADFETEMLKAIDTYTKAIELQDGETPYWQYRSRLRYALWLREDLVTDRGALLDGSVSDITIALERDPENAGIQRWANDIYRAATAVYERRGDTAQEAGDTVAAFGFYEQAFEWLKENAGIAFKTGEMAWLNGDLELAENWYTVGINTAIGQQDLPAIPQAQASLDLLSAANEELPTDRIMSLFQQMSGRIAVEAEMDPDNVGLAFMAGGSFLQAGNIEQAVAWYNAGIERVYNTGDLSALQDAIALLDLLPDDRPAQAIKTQLEAVLADADGLAERNPTRADLAFEAGLAKLNAQDVESAAIWYHEGLARAGRAANRNVLEQAVDKLLLVFTECESCDVGQFYRAMDGNLESFLTDNRDLAQNDAFWAYRGRMDFLVGRWLFNTEQPNLADVQFIVDAMIRDSRLSANIAPDERRVNFSNLIWADFFENAGIGWFYLRQGDAHYTAGEYELALEDYVEAVNRIELGTAATVNDGVEGRLNAGISALILNDPTTAETYFADAFTIIQNAPTRRDIDPNRLQLTTIVQNALEKLVSAPNIPADLQPLAEQYKSQLQEAQ